VQALYFDGHSARATPVRLHVTEAALHAVAADPGGNAGAEAATAWQWPLTELVWPERTRHGQRTIELKGGGTLVATDAVAFDAWRARHGHRDGWIVRAQQHWRGVALALMLLVATVAGGYRWGVPLIARGIVAVVPQAADQALGDAALASLDRQWLAPSRIDAARQDEWRARFGALMDQAMPDAGRRLAWQLHFRSGGESLGANALALPGGHIVITDEMLALLVGHEDTVLGVLAHEYGHIEHRHGMHAVARLTLVSLAVSVALGDFSSVIVAVPVLLAQAGYSREAEREADAAAARLLRASGRSPEVMVLLFEKMGQQRDDKKKSESSASRTPNLPIAFASHPQDDERIRFFREAAR